MPIGLPEILIILVVVLLLFGAKRLPEMGRSLGSGMREFKDGVSGREESSARRAQPAERTEPARLDAAPADDATATPAAREAAAGARTSPAETVTAEPVPEGDRGSAPRS